MSSEGFLDLLILKWSTHLMHRQRSSVVDDSVERALSRFKFSSEVDDRLDITQVEHFFLNATPQVVGVRKLPGDVVLGLLEIVHRSAHHDDLRILLQEELANVFSQS